MNWTPKQHMEHQKLLQKMEQERRVAPQGRSVRRKNPADPAERGPDLNPANSANPEAVKTPRRKKRKKKARRM